MKRQTKKGPRRSRAMPVSTKRFVVTDYDGCGYITAGKPYKLESGSQYQVAVKADSGQWIYSHSFAGHMSNRCAHLNCHKWRWATL